MSEIEETDFFTTPFANARPAPVEMTVLAVGKYRKNASAKATATGCDLVELLSIPPFATSR
jgi:hypothetical protein